MDLFESSTGSGKAKTTTANIGASKLLLYIRNALTTSDILRLAPLNAHILQQHAIETEFETSRRTNSFNIDK